MILALTRCGQVAPPCVQDGNCNRDLQPRPPTEAAGSEVPPDVLQDYSAFKVLSDRPR